MRLKRILILILTILTVFLSITSTFAAATQLTLEGDITSKPKETKVLTVKLSSETEIGAISGKIVASGNIEKISVKGKNDWNLTFNKETGIFNTYKAEGSKVEELIDIEYTAKNAEGTGKITISNLKITTLDYETIEASNLQKEIEIKKEEVTQNPNPTPDQAPNNPDSNLEQDKTQNKEEDKPQDKEQDKNLTLDKVELTKIEITKKPTKTIYTEGEKFDKTGMKVIAKYSDGTTKEITKYVIENGDKLAKGQNSVKINYTEGTVVKTVEQQITVRQIAKNEVVKNENKSDGNSNVVDNKKVDNTVAGTKIPNAGVSSVITIITIFAVFGFVSFSKYNKYKGI